jgi:hypothetical protein
MTRSIWLKLSVSVPLRRDSPPISLSTSGTGVASRERFFGNLLCMGWSTAKAKTPSITRGFEILEHRLPDILMICRIRHLSSAFDCPPKAKAPRLTRSLRWY